MKQLITSFLVITALGMTACSQANAPQAESSSATAVAAKTKAVLIYADWCGSCKILDPKVKAIQASANIPGLDFVTLDFTDKNPENFYAQADAAGVSDAMKTYLAGTIKTGQLVLVDMDDQKALSKVTKTFEPADIVTALKDAVSAS